MNNFHTIVYWLDYYKLLWRTVGSIFTNQLTKSFWQEEIIIDSMDYCEFYYLIYICFLPSVYNNIQLCTDEYFKRKKFYEFYRKKKNLLLLCIIVILILLWFLLRMLKGVELKNFKQRNDSIEAFKNIQPPGAIFTKGSEIYN